jgi:hypothetical protein
LEAESLAGVAAGAFVSLLDFSFSFVSVWVDELRVDERLSVE